MRDIIKHSRLQFKGKNLYLPFPTNRIGVCNYCRAVEGIDCNKTDTHHDNDRYDITNPVKYTIELCVACHKKETARIRRDRTNTITRKEYMKLWMRNYRIKLKNLHKV